MPSFRHLACSAGFLAAALAAPAAAAQATRPYVVPSVAVRGITWGPCTTQSVKVYAPVLGERLRCGTLLAPRDHHQPADGDITVSVVRVAARLPDRRRGVLFVNPGGPGGDAGFFAGMLAAIWANAKPDDAVHGEKKRLADEFDLVAVIPRGMSGSVPLQCPLTLKATTQPILIDRSPRNIAAWDRMARGYAQACRDDPLYPYVTTAQTVYDHDLVRRALGEATFNFYGVSYGTWLGAWYGATYPGVVGRMVFDSSMDYTRSIEANYLQSLPAAQESFVRLVARPAANRPAVYGLGSDPAAVVEVLRGLEPRVRDAWTGNFSGPEHLMAARIVSDWLLADPALEKSALSNRIGAHAFSDDAGINQLARDAALNAIEEIYAPPVVRQARLSAMAAMIVTIGCNDTAATADAGAWHRTIADAARDYPAGHSGDLMNPCVFSHGPNAVKPPIERLARAGRIMMIQSEFDRLTPVTGALRTLNELPNAKMLILRGSDAHTVFTVTDEPCIERTGARFLLDGRAPSSQLTECMVSLPSGPSPEHFTQPVQVRAWRSQMARQATDGGRRALLAASATVEAEDAP
ncbi:alpha/beta hydrolase [Bacillus sp. NP157]|nr:alpha/beta hydrolase [Bacillus sp. NP157]